MVVDHLIGVTFGAFGWLVVQVGSPWHWFSLAPKLSWWGDDAGHPKSGRRRYHRLLDLRDESKSWAFWQQLPAMGFGAVLGLKHELQGAAAWQHMSAPACAWPVRCPVREIQKKMSTPTKTVWTVDKVTRKAKQKDRPCREWLHLYSGPWKDRNL